MTDARTPEEIERDIEAERAHLTSNLDDLQQRFSIDGIIREVSDQFRNHGGEVSRNIADQVKQNPLALAVTAAGLAWLAFGSNRTVTAAPVSDTPYRGNARTYPAMTDYDQRPLSRYGDDLPQRSPSYAVSDTEPTWARSVGGIEDYDYDYEDGEDEDHSGLSMSERAAKVREAVAKRSKAMSDSAGQAGGYAADNWNAAREGARLRLNDARLSAQDRADRTKAAYTRMRTQMADGTDHLTEQARDRVVAARMRAVEVRNAAGRNLQYGADATADAFDDQPLVFGAIALAVGAAIGGALPRTRREDELMGTQSDALYHEAERILGDEMEKAKHVASAAADEVQNIAQEKRDQMDSSAPGGKNATDAAIDEAKSAASRVADRARSEADKEGLGNPKG